MESLETLLTTAKLVRAEITLTAAQAEAAQVISNSTAQEKLLNAKTREAPITSPPSIEMIPSKEEGKRISMAAIETCILTM